MERRDRFFSNQFLISAVLDKPIRIVPLFSVISSFIGRHIMGRKLRLSSAGATLRA
jgi:hypothetical protein